MNVALFKLPNRPDRSQALNWLASVHKVFPSDIAGDIGPNLFHGWRFIRSTHGVIYFADCLHVGIDDSDFKQFVLNPSSTG